ncbi:hypothetical protein M501DRAFT_534098 [Patellaria atrata CBS 101060]|uniref:Uncharacterized protein n=1 Tax=Patellaria atrata CBS 101060 TaxID=1346257 RepID=A0A9P4SGD2_9PEZI|nr:hypothetical protein M501DRAFT_534098 [Patellaria atrata CBS 101060]
MASSSTSSSAPAVPLQNLRVGVEVETLLTPGDKNLIDLPGRKARINAIDRILVQKIDPSTGEPRYTLGDLSGYRQWAIIEDAPIDPYYELHSEDVPLEFASPILQSHPSHKWRKEITDLFSDFAKISEIDIFEICGTHIHLSPVAEDAGGFWDLPRLKSIAMARNLL